MGLRKIHEAVVAVTVAPQAVDSQKADETDQRGKFQKKQARVPRKKIDEHA